MITPFLKLSADTRIILDMPNRSSKPKRPRDINQLGKLILDITTGEIEEDNPDDGKDPNAVALGRKGGLVGGVSRAKKLSAEQRRRIAEKAAHARWKK